MKYKGPERAVIFDFKEGERRCNCRKRMSGQIIFILHRQAIMKARRACLVAARKIYKREGREFGTSSPFIQGFPGGSDGKASAYNAGNAGSISGSGRSPG